MLLPEDMSMSDDVVTLRRWRAGDEDAVYRALCDDPSVSRWTRVPWPYTRGHAEWFLRSTADDWVAGTAVHFAITVEPDDVPVGSISCMHLGAEPEPGSALAPDEVGYWVARDARGRGVARRALTLLCAWAFEYLDRPRLHLRTRPGNDTSQRVALACGFSFVRCVPERFYTDSAEAWDEFVLERPGPSGAI